MKRTPPVPTDEIRPEYEFAAMKGGVRGKYVQRIREGTNIVVIEPKGRGGRSQASKSRGRTLRD